MSSVVLKNIKARDLPAEFAEGLDADPDELVRVTIDAEYHRNVRKLFEIADRASAEAERRGLTDEKLAEILDEED